MGAMSDGLGDTLDNLTKDIDGDGEEELVAPNTMVPVDDSKGKVKEGKKLLVNEDYLNEVAGLFVANLALNAPSIISLAGKLSNKLGEKLNVKLLKKSGDVLESLGSKLQGKYMSGIKSILKKLEVTNAKGATLSEEELDKVTKVIFMSMLAIVGVAIGVAGVHSLASSANTALGYGKSAVVADRVRGVAKGLMKLDKQSMMSYAEKLIPKAIGEVFGAVS
jgi:hypothetical protein